MISKFIIKHRIVLRLSKNLSEYCKVLRHLKYFGTGILPRHIGDFERVNIGRLSAHRVHTDIIHFDTTHGRSRNAISQHGLRHDNLHIHGLIDRSRQSIDIQKYAAWLSYIRRVRSRIGYAHAKRWHCRVLLI